MKIPFNKPYLTGKELHFINEAHSLGQLAGDGYFSKRCSAWLEEKTSCQMALLTHSCTAALEMAAILADIKPGDEIIMPSYTFVSTANAFALRGGVPVFVDIRSDTLNINENLIEAAITEKTKAIVPVHYAGAACEMDTIMNIAKKYSLFVVEDAAQAIMSKYKGRTLGSIGHLGCLSFHETKNIISGEGGALLINDISLIERAEIIREKGTNRKLFLRGAVDKYTWVDIGSSFLPGEIIAAFLWAQMQEAENITSHRLCIWEKYQKSMEIIQKSFNARRPIIADGCVHNAHMYYLILNSLDQQKAFIHSMSKHGIQCVFHYIPLHIATQGIRIGRAHGDMSVTCEISDRIVRLPLWIGLEKWQDRIIESTSYSLQ